MGVHDPYSADAAKAFELVAEDKKIDVCLTKFDANPKSMEAALKEIIAKNCCQLTVVFAQVKDLVSLFLQAHKQQYTGEWIVGNSLVGSVADVVKDLERHDIPEPAVHKLLRGRNEFALEQYWHTRSSPTTFLTPQFI